MNALILALAGLAVGAPAEPSWGVFTSLGLWDSRWIRLGSVLSGGPTDNAALTRAGGLRQQLEVGYGSSKELSIGLGLSFDDDLEATLANLAGSVQWRALAVRTEVSTIEAELHPALGVIFEPGLRRASGRIVDVRIGWDVLAAGHGASARSAGLVFGAGLVRVRQPLELVVRAETSVTTSDDVSLALPSTAIDRDFTSTAVGFWFATDSLKGLMVSGNAPLSALFVDGDRFKLGLGFDLNVLLGFGTDAISDEGQALIHRQTGLAVDTGNTSRPALCWTFDYRSGLLARWDLDVGRVGVMLAYQGGMLSFLGLSSTAIPKDETRDLVVRAVPSGQHIWLIHGPVLRLAIVL